MINVSGVWRASSGSQDSIHCGVGTNELEPKVLIRERLVVLFCLGNDEALAGILPRAFSDMALTCNGTMSSVIEEEIDAARELWSDRVDCEGVGRSPSSSESSSPIANVPSSTGPSAGLLSGLVGLVISVNEGRGD